MNNAGSPGVVSMSESGVQPSVEPAREPVIEAVGVSKTFRDFWGRPRVKAVRGVSFQVRRGEVFGLLGPNGSGKSTILKMALGLLTPSGGVIRVLGRSPRDVRAKARLGYLPEDTYLYRHLTAAETLDFYGRLFDLDGRERRERVGQLLEMTGLSHARNRPVGEFSKGMARRIGLAQALINDPDLLILDEPTSGLDPIGCRQVKDLLLALARRGKTVLLSSHLLADVEDVCGRIAILCDGNVIVHGATRELLEEKRSLQLTFGAMDSATFQALLAALKRDFDLNPEVRHPTRKLEEFFLAAIERSRTLDAGTASGAAPTREVAKYLVAEDAQTTDILESLTRPRSEYSQPESDQSNEIELDLDKQLRNLVNPGGSNT